MKYLKEFDWSTTALGSRDTWSPALQSVYDMMMSSGFAMFATWGPERTFIYNHAYFPFLGARHPKALGKPIEQVWPDVWNEIGPLVEKAMSGEAVYVEDMHLVMTRNGHAEDTWWTFSYSPLRENGQIMGILDVATDRTETVLLRKSLQARNEKLVESEAQLLKLVTAGAFSLFRMSPDWLEMQRLEGQGILEDTPAPSAQWLDVYIDEEDRPDVLAAIARAIKSRTNFDLEHRIRTADGSYGWVHSRAVPILDDDGNVVEWFGAASDITARRTAEAQQTLLNQEISHRLKNVLALVQAVTMQTLRTATDIEAARKAISSRIGALGRAQDVLMSGATNSVQLRRVVEEAVGEQGILGDTIRIEGPDVKLGPTAALNLTLTLHELATNAAKYGALSVPGGKVVISWEVSVRPATLWFRWQEGGGPRVAPPFNKGFGSKLTERSLVGGSAELRYDPSGVVFTLEVPLTKLMER